MLYIAIFLVIAVIIVTIFILRRIKYHYNAAKAREARRPRSSVLPTTQISGDRPTFRGTAREVAQMVFVNERAAESEVHLGEGRAVNRGMVSDSELPAYSSRAVGGDVVVMPPAVYDPARPPVPAVEFRTTRLGLQGYGAPSDEPPKYAARTSIV